jgi:putative transposase
MQAVDETWQLVALPIYATVALPNHWHFVVRPTTDDQVNQFFRRLTVMHRLRWPAHYQTGGSGHLYQGRFQSFPIQGDQHWLTAMRYVERNPWRANFVDQAEDWHWSSASIRRSAAARGTSLATPSDPPLPRTWRAWSTVLNQRPKCMPYEPAFVEACPTAIPSG